MPAIGGSIQSVILDGREFPVAADAEANRKLGGVENELVMNGDGSGRLIQTRVPAQFSGLSLECDDDRGDHEFLTELQRRKAFFPASVTFASGVTYGGLLQIVGEMQYASQASTVSLDLAGPGQLTKQ